MKTAELKEYLSMVLALEIQHAVTENIKNDIIQKKFVANLLPEIPYMDAKNVSLPKQFKIPKALIGAVIGIVTTLFLGSSRIIIGVADLMGGSIFSFLWIIFGLVGPTYIGATCGLGMDEKNDKKRREAIANEKNRSIDIENSAIKKKNNELQKSANAKNALIEKSYQELDKTSKETAVVLQQAYSSNIIYPKYRNLYAISALYEYISSGRCTELQGAHGAYDTFEYEDRLNCIIKKLDGVISHLSTIVENQHRILSNQSVMINNQQNLSNTIENMKVSLSQLGNTIKSGTDKLNEIAVNTAVTAYTAKVIERNQYYQRNYINGKGFYDRMNLS